MFAPSAPHPLSAHPHPLTDGSLDPPCSTTSAELAVPMRHVGDPNESTDPLNWRCTESLPSELFCAFSRTQT